MTMAGEMKDGFYDPVERAASIEATLCKEELRKAGKPYHVAYRPESIPPEQV